MNKLSFNTTSIGKKQIVAVTGLLLIGFLVAHLAGNLFIYAGPEALNGYAKKLASLRPALYLVESGLAGIFVIHIYFTTLIVLENINARKNQYAVFKASGERSWATRIMPYTGTIVLAFVIWHLLDFTFIDHHGSRSIMPDGENLGLYGVVYNSFSDPVHSSFYVIAMMAIGFHLSHGIQSFFQTFGLQTAQNTSIVKKISHTIGFLIALGYSSIPIYVFIDSLKYTTGIS